MSSVDITKRPTPNNPTAVKRKSSVLKELQSAAAVERIARCMGHPGADDRAHW
jgi:hypothetical protein